MAKRYRDGDVVVESESNLAYFFLGLGVGVAAGLLFAPQSGAETRRLLKDKAEEGVDYVKRRGLELQNDAADALERSKEGLRRQRESLAEAVEAGRQAYREAAERD
jgi:gas vesicle protein